MNISKEKMRDIRLQLVHQMHDYIMKTGDERIFEVWMSECIPDCPDEEDFEFFTDPTEFREMCEIFGYLVCCNEKF